MRLIPLDELKNANYTHENKIDRAFFIANIIYYFLQCEISIKELYDLPDDIKNGVYGIIYCTANHDFYDIEEALNSLLTEIYIDEGNGFSVEEFFDKPDKYKRFKLECPYNINKYKSALGYILPNQAFYCNVAEDHAITLTALIRRENPDFEDLDSWENNHPEQPDWHNALMNNQQAIIIHFIPNEYPSVIYIPSKISKFQYDELSKLEQILQAHNITTTTNYKELDLTDVLKDNEFYASHVNNAYDIA